MNIIKETTLIQKEIEQIKQNLSNNKFLNLQNSTNNPNSMFNTLEIRKISESSSLNPEKNMENVNNSFYAKNINKAKRKIFRVTYLKTVIPYLDLKSMLNISILNKEFYYFIKSIYFYKFMDNIKNFKNKKNIPIKDNYKTPKKSNNSNIYSVGNNLNEQTSAGKIGSLFGALTKSAISMLGKNNFLIYLYIFLGFTSGAKQEEKNVYIDPLIMENKINLYEKILTQKLKNAKVNTELKGLRENINLIIENRQKKLEINNGKITENTSNNKPYSSFRTKSILNEEEFEKIKKEKLEKEYFNLLEEIKELKEEVIFLFINLGSNFKK